MSPVVTELRRAGPGATPLSPGPEAPNGATDAANATGAAADPARPGRGRVLGAGRVWGRSEAPYRPDAADAYRELAPAVLGYLRARQAPDPEDVLGEVFLQVSRDLDRFQGGPTDLRRWVFTIAHNRMTDAFRRRARRPVIADREAPVTVAPPDPAPVDEDLVAALQQLGEDQREVVVLRFVADLSLEDVAEITGRNVNAVKAMQHRALANLRRALTAAGEAAPEVVATGV